MKPYVDGQVVPLAEALGLSRRDFCGAVVAGAALVTLHGCGGDGLERVGAGALSVPGAPPNGDPQPDSDDMAGEQSSDDLAMRNDGNPDLAHAANNPPDLSMMQQQGTCPGGLYDSGTTPATVTADTAVYVGNQSAFICHDAGGYFAVSSICTHAGCTTKWTGTEFYCHCHGASFTLTGTVTGGPAHSALQHYLVCLTAKGTIGISSGTTVSAATRYAL